MFGRHPKLEYSGAVTASKCTNSYFLDDGICQYRSYLAPLPPMIDKSIKHGSDDLPLA